MTRVADSLVAPYVKREKIKALAERLAKDIPRGSGFSVGRRRSLARKFERDITPVRTRIIQDRAGVGADLISTVMQYLVIGLLSTSKSRLLVVKSVVGYKSNSLLQHQYH